MTTCLYVYPASNHRVKPKTLAEIEKPPNNGICTGVFGTILQNLKDNSEHLPSIPSVCIRVKKALANPNTNVQCLTKLIARDPALSAFLIKAGTSPAYRSGPTNPSLDQVVRFLGFETIKNLVVLHSVKSLFFNQHKELKHLCNYTWRLLAIKAGIATLLARKTQFTPIDHAMLAAIYTELGSLAILSVLRSSPNLPDLAGYIGLCRSYSVSISTLILHKWQSEQEFIETVKHLGQWQYCHDGDLDLFDLVNLAHYHSLALLTRGHVKLPPVYQLSAFYKLPKALSNINDQGLLTEVVDDKITLARLANTFL